MGPERPVCFIPKGTKPAEIYMRPSSHQFTYVRALFQLPAAGVGWEGLLKSRQSLGTLCPVFELLFPQRSGSAFHYSE